jgi:hypothetical protein
MHHIIKLGPGYPKMLNSKAKPPTTNNYLLAKANLMQKPTQKSDPISVSATITQTTKHNSLKSTPISYHSYNPKPLDYHI